MKMGHAERTSTEPDESYKVSSRIYYMPHHAVVRSESTTTRVRVVFDASAHGPEYSSLNDCLEKSPNLLTDIVALLIWFWVNPIALTTDIEKAFLQISIKKEDQDALRFFWFKDSRLQRIRNLK